MGRILTSSGPLVGAGLSRREWLELCGGGAILFAAGGIPNVAWAQAQETPKYGGVLVSVQGSDPPHFDPFSSGSSTILNILASCHNSLLMMDPVNPDKVIGDLAQSWDISPDGKAYTFKLVPNAKFHDGAPLTSADVKFTFDVARDPPANIVSIRKNLLSAIEDIQVPDPYTVRMVLKYPSPALIPTLATGYFLIVAKHTMEKEGDLKRTINGSGPFKFKNQVKGVSVELVKNENYHVKGRPYLDGIKYFTVPDESTRYAYLRSGQIMYWDNMSGTLARRAEKEFGDKITILSKPSYIGESFTFNAANKPFDDIRVRKALIMSIDRQEAVKVISDGDGAIAGLQPSDVWGLPIAEIEKIPGYGKDMDANRAEAKKLLAEAGHGGGLSITIMTRKASTTNEARAVFMADQFSKVGVTAKIDVKETAAYFDALNKRNFAVATMSMESSANDPDHFFGDAHTCNSDRNYSGVCSPEADALFRQQSGALDPAERKRIVNQLERAVLAGYGMEVLYFRIKYIAIAKSIRNLVMHPESDNNRRLQDVWLA